MKLSASIVLYNTKIEDLKRVIDSYFAYQGEKQLFLVDNSPTDKLKDIVEMYPNKDINYMFNNENMGYGKAHNIAIKKSIEQELPYHIILNPDIIIEEGTLEKLTIYMEQHPEIGNIMPKIIYPNGELQYLCKLLPSPIDLIFRRFIPLKKWKDNINKRYELHAFEYDKIFMYLEDIDLNRRIHSQYKTIYYPDATVTHEHQKESYKSKKLLKAHIKSAIYYFNKYGWFFDKERTNINRNVLRELEKLK